LGHTGTVYGPYYGQMELGLFKSYPIGVMLGMAASLMMPAAAQWQGDSEASLAQCLPQDAWLARGEPRRDPDAPLSIRADVLSSVPNQPFVANKAVVVDRGDQHLETESIVYDPSTGMIELPMWLSYTDAFIAIEAERARLNMTESTGFFEAVQYRIAGAQGSGEASEVRLINENQAALQRFDFTTCDPTNPDWQLIARNVDLDLEKSVGTARNARLEFKGVPLFYLPWFSFPLNDERKSGFLYPSFGLSSSDGLDLSIPWYWNIAPNVDATLTPRWIQDRGAMLGVESRFLTQRQSGQINLEVLPDDKKANDDRYQAKVDYRSRLADRWSSNVRLRRVSDAQYFLDLGGGLDATAIQYMRSTASVQGRGEHWSMSIGGDFFQVLDDRIAPQNEPYRRLPRVLFSLDRPLHPALRLSLDNEWVYFDRDQGVRGGRVDVFPNLEMTHRKASGFLRANAGIRMTAYELENAAVDSPSRTTPIMSLDGGLFFERALSNDRIQTLEPRVYYLYVPTKDQSDLPVFDTAGLTFGFAQLFHNNRFAGADRQGDANQVTLALSSRMLEGSTGRSIVDFNVGQILYFKDRQVQLPNQSVEQANRSEWVAEASWSIARSTAIRAGLQWDPEITALSTAYASIQHRSAGGWQGALAYRFRRNVLDQVDARVRYPLTESLNFIARSVYSLRDNDSLELLAGFEYESCCWALRLTAREYIRDREATKQTAVFLELHLKGLGSLGRQPYPLF